MVGTPLTDSQRAMMSRVLGHAHKNSFLLKNGSRGTTVRALQLFLRDKGYDISSDGVFGEQTNDALKQYQAKAKLNTDGVAGSRTFKAIKAEVDTMPPLSPAAVTPPVPNMRPPLMDEKGTTSSAGMSMGTPPMPNLREALMGPKEMIGPPPAMPMPPSAPSQADQTIPPEMFPPTPPPDQTDEDVAWYQDKLRNEGRNEADIAKAAEMFRRIAMAQTTTDVGPPSKPESPAALSAAIGGPATSPAPATPPPSQGIWEAIVQGLIGAQLPPDESRNFLTNDQGSTPAAPPAFTSPMGAYR